MSFIKRYLIALKKYPWVPVVSTVVTTGAAGVLTLFQSEPPAQYQASGALALNQPAAQFSETGLAIQQAGQELNRDVLLSADVVQVVAKRSGLKEALLARSLTVDVQQPDEKKKKPFRVDVAFTGGNPEQAKVVIDTMLEGMIERSRSINSLRLRERIKAVETRLPRVTQDLRQAEQLLERYNRREEADILAARGGALVGAIATAQEQQRQLKQALEGTRAQMSSLEKRLGLSTDQAYVSSALSADPIIGSLRAQIYQLEQQLSISRRDLRPQHPRMVEMRNQLTVLEDQLRQRANEVVGGGQTAPLVQGRAVQVRQESSLDPTRRQLADTLVALKTQEETVVRQLQSALETEQQLRREYATFPNKQLEQQRLAQQVALKKALFDKIQAALVDAKAAEAETVTSLRIDRLADVSPLPTPKSVSSAILILGGGGLGVILGGGLVFLLSALEGRYYTKEEIQSALRQQSAPLLELLPLFLPPRGLEEIEEFVPLMTDNLSPYLNSYERLRGTIQRTGTKGTKVVLVSSAIGGEGKTHCAYNLAIASAFAGKRTLLIEADLRKPTLIRALGVAPDLGSTVEPLQYYGNTSDCIRLVPSLENLFIVPSTGPQRQPSAILESSEMRRLLEDARGRFDFVVIDSPSLLRYNDAMLLDPYVDGLVLVTRPGITQASMFVEAIEVISDNQLPFFGVVINGTDISVEDEMSVDEDDLPLAYSQATGIYAPYGEVNSPYETLI